MNRVLILLLPIGALGWFLFAALFRDTVGQDWMVFDLAARAYWRGDTALLLDGVKFTAVLNATYTSLAQPLVFHPWVYPPYTLLLVLPFGLLPWWLSFGGFQAVTFAAMAASLRPWCADWRQYALVLGGIVLCPATAYNIGAGQNVFLSAALLLAGFRLLETRPIAAGIVLGILAFKPQLGLLLPVVLAVAGAWRSFAAAAATVIALVLLSLVAPGIAVWRGLLHLYVSGDQPRQWVELYGQSIFTVLRLAGAPPLLANIGQLAAVLIGATAVWKAFRSPMDKLRKLTVLLCAIAFSAPHFGDYDAVLLAIAAMLLLLPASGTPTRMVAGLSFLVWCSTAINPPYLFAQTIPALFPLSELTPLVVLALLLRLAFGSDPVRPRTASTLTAVPA